MNHVSWRLLSVLLADQQYDASLHTEGFSILSHWMVANALWGSLQQRKQSNWQRRGKPIGAAALWQDTAARVQNAVVKRYMLTMVNPQLSLPQTRQEKKVTISTCHLRIKSLFFQNLAPSYYSAARLAVPALAEAIFLTAHLCNPL